MQTHPHSFRWRRQKTLAAFVRRADGGTLSRLLVQASILLATSRGNPTAILKEAATAYKVDTEAIATKIRQKLSGYFRDISMWDSESCQFWSRI